MAFNDHRRKLAVAVKTKLGEAALYRPKAGGEIATPVVVHRAVPDEDGVVQDATTITIFRVGDADDIVSPKHGDTIVLTGSSETFKVDTGGHTRDEFKTRLAVTDVTGMPDDD